MINDALLARARALKLYGILERWDEIKDCEWVRDLITWEEAARTKRSLERRQQTLG